jgi:hypothetical protein
VIRENHDPCWQRPALPYCQREATEAGRQREEAGVVFLVQAYVHHAADHDRVIASGKKVVRRTLNGGQRPLQARAAARCDPEFQPCAFVLVDHPRGEVPGELLLLGRQEMNGEMRARSGGPSRGERLTTQTNSSGGSSETDVHELAVSPNR